jgi:hypothetical protein
LALSRRTDLIETIQSARPACVLPASQFSPLLIKWPRKGKMSQKKFLESPPNVNILLRTDDS